MKDAENKNEDVQARIKLLLKQIRFHTNVPILGNL